MSNYDYLGKQNVVGDFFKKYQWHKHIIITHYSLLISN